MSKKTKLIQKLSNYDWRYIVDCSYDITESSYHYELCANDYCRCTTLENLKVEITSGLTPNHIVRLFCLTIYYGNYFLYLTYFRYIFFFISIL